MPTSTSRTKSSIEGRPERTDVFRILGIDPGSHSTGYGLLEESGGRLREIESGAIRPGRDKQFLHRLSDIHEALSGLVIRFKPDAVAVENPFLARNVRSAMQLGEARAAALLPAVRAGIPVFEYAPRHVKAAVVGHGGAEKAQVARMVALLLGLSDLPTPLDATDALAVAICHANRSSGLRRLQKSLA
jgi:crossover junction endodeoxyribonuclease RuvC